MSKHHLQNLAEQIANKGYGSAPFHYVQNSNHTGKLMESGDIQTKIIIDNDFIQLRAYQIHQEKGGSALDNWLEAEGILRKDD